jgi:hypothetical protein
MRFALIVPFLFAVLALPGTISAAGLASGGHFSVITPATPTQQDGDRYARLVLERAEQFRQAFAEEWFGQVTSTDVRTVISVSFSKTEKSGLTLARDNAAQRFHNIFLRSTPESAAGTLLQHEIAHTVLATAYPHRLPPWADEGIASRYDSDELHAVRAKEIQAWVRAGQFPRLADLLVAADIQSFDGQRYAAAESLVNYLLTLGDRRTLLRFADEGQRSGWDAALRACYQIDGVGQLQRDWQAWVAETSAAGR